MKEWKRTSKQEFRLQGKFGMGLPGLTSKLRRRARKGTEGLREQALDKPRGTPFSPICAHPPVHLQAQVLGHAYTHFKSKGTEEPPR